MIPRLAVAASALLCVLGLAACESSQDKAAELRANAEADTASQQGVVIGKPNKDIEVGATSLINDKYGTAVAVELTNTSDKAQVEVPIRINVLDAGGKRVFSNDIPGLDPSLTHVALLKPGETSYWVHDQIQPSGDPKSLKVEVGAPEEAAPAAVPELKVSSPRVHEDSSGTEVEGQVTNESQVDQQQLVLFAVARRGGDVVAAGRGVYKVLSAGGKPLPFNIFFIGDPSGADVQVLAPPTDF